MFKYLSTIMKNCEKTTANQIFYKCNETVLILISKFNFNRPTR